MGSRTRSLDINSILEKKESEDEEEDDEDGDQVIGKNGGSNV